MNRFEPAIHRKWRNSARYQNQRSIFLSENPGCVPCEEKGLTEGSEEVHHVVRPAGDEGLFFDVGNWLAVCHDCHVEIERKFNASKKIVKGRAKWLEHLRQYDETPVDAGAEEAEAEAA